MINLECRTIKFSGHALQRMFERKLNKDDILQVLSQHEVVASYEDDRPYPSFLILGWKNSTPIHVVVATDGKSKTCIIVTTYIPESGLWEPGFKRRRKL